MGIKILDIEDAINDNGIKALVYGEAGAGKTVLCSTMNQPTIILSAESGLLSLKKVLREKPELKKLIKTIIIKTVDDLQEALEFFQDNPERVCNWICLDSISEIAEQILKAEKEVNKDARQAYGNLTTRCLDILRAFRDLPRYNVLMTAKMARHETDEGVGYFTTLFPGKGVGANIPYLFDEVFALRIIEEEVDGELVKQRLLQTEKDVKYEAKDRSGELRAFEPPNMAKIFKRIRGYDEVNFSEDESIAQEVDLDEDRYWWHSTKDKYLVTNVDDDVSDFEEDSEILEISFEQYEAREMTLLSEEEVDSVVEKVVAKNEEDDEPVISTKIQYWHHTPSDGYLITEEDTDIASLLLDDAVIELTKADYEKATDVEEDEKPSIPANETKLQKAKREMAEQAALAAKKK
jgi:hypothetical protein